MSYYFKPATITEALSLASDYSNNYVYFGGGTDLQIYRKQKLIKDEAIIDLSGLTDTYRIQADGNALRLGAFVTLDDITSAPEIQKLFPLLAEAAASVATPVIRKTATIGGNLLVNNRCTFYNQSKEWRDAVGSCMREVGATCLVTGGKDKCFSRNVSDTAPALITLNATVTVQTQKGEDEIPLKEIYAPDGIKYHQHMDDAILTAIRVPEKPVNWWFKKLRLRKTLDFTSLTVAAAIDTAGMARVCLNGVSMSPILIEKPIADLTLEGLTRSARKNCKTVDNDLMPLKYRREMINVYLNEWWQTVKDK
ncbi:MAG TPA: FAD binding domain-containing protein [Candidatus Marinimicrobia bacterium]|jgi:4-hydroxybenzoyl-CoA reductase subunit beta|nr:FAD binding domain-containing protein [Candidatus Neomarinimicrobiota bacterium]MDP7329862.1 FAD binding domain-containing protein [Candidatus Neomarinimicrobiota bacterium]MDP7436313.1 FAD binding domain-containing protein [Candidatus Neomarinimicrobiota bacterium]HBN45643.1 hypothetical protein [Candidatus Neomarinimicrobiota bacterium]HJM69441.1 FAD binding domain-containing protein [Candidatus Neomarinimicrobiota bacterium]|tara:strand:+ start:1638 stop:2564 length:927 start_codon:yes stop_codon:yes gene_type:complete